MCDYSLHGIASRPAKVGDELTTKRFVSGTTGFHASDDASKVVCVLPGTEVAFRDKVTFSPNGGLDTSDIAVCTVARFRQTNLDVPHVHHDALEFADGQVILLHHLGEGQRADVLQLPADPATLQGKAAEEAKLAQRRLEFIY